MAGNVAAATDADLLIERGNGVGWMILNRPPKRNALTVPMQARMDSFLTEAAGDPGIRAVILGANGGGTFCAGGDFAEKGDMPDALYQQVRSAQMFHTCQSFIDFPKPLVVALGGLACGSGCILAWLADARVATEAGAFSLPEILRGRPTFAGAVVASRLLGEAAATDLVQSGRTMGAAEAVQRGLVQAIVPPAELRERAAEMALKLASHAAPAFAQNKEWIHRDMRRLLQEAEQASREVKTPLTVPKRKAPIVVEDNDGG